MNTRKTITSLNTKITILSDIIQKSRITLVSMNQHIPLNSSDTRRIVLICLMYIRKNPAPIGSEMLTLTDIYNFLEIADCNPWGLCDSDIIPPINLNTTLIELSRLKQYPYFCDLINYALESLEYDVDEYFNVTVSRGTRSSNKKKKSNGIYYTPTDVVNFMISQCISAVLPQKAKPSVLDCSCGSGMFLLQSLIYLENACNPNRNLDISFDLLEKCIWGIDISEAAVDCSKAVFMQYYLDNYAGVDVPLDLAWRIVDHSFVVGDATQLDCILSQHQELPSVFDCIVGNPPYVTLGRESNLFIPFVENMMDYASDNSCSALVLPLSVCYSQGAKFIYLRERIQNDKVTWTFMNYDRSPDSLFGDQVKTRSTILFRNSFEHKAMTLTTTLQRWTSSKRDRLFTDYVLCDISGVPISKNVPKISHIIEKRAFDSIRQGTQSLQALFARCRSDYPLVVNGTAYNWIGAYDHLPPSTDESGDDYVSTTTKVYYLSDIASRDFCIAVLCNRIAYWYWIVTGDGFHLNASFLADYCIGKDNFTDSQYNELCRLGSKYSLCIKEHPTISYNAGKRIVNYDHWQAMDIIRQIEKIIIDALNLPEDFVVHLDRWYFNQVHCNRDTEKR